jgi:hypothetical protein
MELSSRGSEPSPFRDRADSRDASTDDAPADDVWFELQGRDATLVGTSKHVVHRRTDQAGGATVREWEYRDLRSVHVIEGGRSGEGGSIVIEPIRGPLVPVPIAAAEREDAFQAATVFELLIARAQRSVPMRNSVHR